MFGKLCRFPTLRACDMLTTVIARDIPSERRAILLAPNTDVIQLLLKHTPNHNEAMKHYIEINCTPDVTFKYIAQLEKHGEWQDAIQKSTKVPAGDTKLGTKNTELRQMPGGAKEVTAEVMVFEPPKKIAAKTISKTPIQADITITVKPIKGGKMSGVTLEAKLTGVGIGKLFVKFARKNNDKQIPKDLARLKQQLEDR